MNVQIVEISAVILGLVQGVLVMLNKRSNWIVYAIQMLMLVLFSYSVKLYGDMVQNMAYFFICVASYWMWKDNGLASEIGRLSKKHIVYICVGTLIATAIVGHILSNTDDPLPYVDAFSTVTTVVALLLMSIHKIECWIVWLVNDIAYMYQYLALPDQAVYLFCLYCVWTCMAVASFIKWLQIYDNQRVSAK